MSTIDPGTGAVIVDDGDIRDILSAAGRHWGLLLFYGVISILVGIVIMVWPSETIAVVAVVFGIYLLVSGIFELIQSFTAHMDTGARVLLAITGVLSILLGIMCLRSLFQSVVILTIFIGLSFMFRGVIDLVAGIQNKGVPGRGLSILSGVVLIIGSLVVLLALATLVLALGAWIMLRPE